MNSYLNIVIWSLAAGICLCNFYIYYNKVILGGFIRALLEKEAFTPDTARALSDLKISSGKLVSIALEKGSHSLYGVVSKTQDGAAYYIPEDKSTKARKMFSSKGVSFVPTVLLSLLVIAAAYLLTLTVPVIISLADSIF